MCTTLRALFPRNYSVVGSLGRRDFLHPPYDPGSSSNSSRPIAAARYTEQIIAVDVHGCRNAGLRVIRDVGVCLHFRVARVHAPGFGTAPL